MGWLWRLLAGWCCPSRAVEGIGKARAELRRVRRARLGDWLLSRPFQ